MTIRILATADLHLGRRPSRLLEQEARECSTGRMWDRIVEQAIQEQVDLVVLAGDVVDFDNRFFEALGPLERGVQCLSNAGIPVCAVAGNHDFDVLSRSADILGQKNFHLLGRGGQWEQAVFQSRSGEAVRIVGWSFPKQYVTQSPLDHFEPFLQQMETETDRDLPTLGLLHGDLDAVSSRYLPVPKAQLQALPVVLWVLGHLHAPRDIEADSGARILVPGSPQGLDPTETGPHGPWLVEIQGESARTARSQLTHWPLAPIRYETLSVDLSGLSDSAIQEDLTHRIRQALDDQMKCLTGAPFPPQRLLVRLELVGPTPLYQQIETWFSDLGQYEHPVDDITARIEQIVNNTRPDLDIDELAKAPHVLGRVAQLIRQLERLTRSDAAEASESPAEGEIENLVTSALKEMENVYKASPYKDIKEPHQKPSRQDAVRILHQQAIRVLEALDSQQRKP